MRSSFVSNITAFGRKIDEWRIKTHLKNTEEDLRSKELDLNEFKQQSREKHLDDLREYWQDGDFPVNSDSDGRKPFFVGPEGTLCAMAYIIDQDGETELVQKVARNDNNVYLEDVEEGELMEWIEESGLRKCEAERIQPTYDHTTYLRLATDCGPLACKTALYGLMVIGSALFAAMEWSAYKKFNKVYPEKPLKRGVSFSVMSVLNIFIVVMGVMIAYAFLP